MACKNGNDIYNALISALERGELKPGMRLREVELAKRYGVSRTPIREGLKRLEAQGLAVHQPNRGMVIPHLSKEQLNELYVVREILEGLAARLAAQHASDAEIAALRELIAQERIRVASPVEYAAANREFHHRLTQAAHNTYLADQIDYMKQGRLLLDGTGFKDEQRRLAATEEHAAIVEAVAARDLERADTAGRRHVRASHRNRLQL